MAIYGDYADKKETTTHNSIQFKKGNHNANDCPNRCERKRKKSANDLKAMMRVRNDEEHTSEKSIKKHIINEEEGKLIIMKNRDVLE